MSSKPKFLIVKPKPLSRRISTAHPTFSRRNRHADMSYKGGTEYGTYKMRKKKFILKRQNLSFWFLANINTHFLKKQFKKKTLCTKMQQMKGEEEEMTQGDAKRWSRNYRGPSEIRVLCVILVWSFWSSKLGTTLVRGSRWMCHNLT